MRSNGAESARNVLDRLTWSTLSEARYDAYPFDLIVIGGGTFGPILAEHVLRTDPTRCRRILLLEAGPFALTEHVRDLGQEVATHHEVWKKAWHGNVAFPGLAYCLGGRSLYWAGWSPRLLDAEMAADPNPWPAEVVRDLADRYFREAGEQLGVDQTNGFIGSLQNALRQQLFDALQANAIANAVPLASLPDHPALRGRSTLASRDLINLLGLPAHQGETLSDRALLDLLKLEAPFATQRQRYGQACFRRFTTVPLLMRASRMAQSEARDGEVGKRLTIVPNCHVKRLSTKRVQGNLRVAGIETSQGFVTIPSTGALVIALGTIESTRLILNALQNEPHSGDIGKNLLAHLRSNFTIRIPRSALKTLDPWEKYFSTAALFMKGRHTHADGSAGHFHLQITATGPDPRGSHAEHITVTIRGVGEMEPNNPNNFVRLDAERDEYGEQRAFVSLSVTSKDRRLWDAMDAAAQDVAKVFAGGGSMEILCRNRDGLGTTHHEAGTLRMGSVTDSDCRLRDLSNAFVVGPALFPRNGSSNPVLTGVALARRLGDHLMHHLSRDDNSRYVLASYRDYSPVLNKPRR